MDKEIIDKARFKQHGLICELYIGRKMPIVDIANKLNTTAGTVSSVLNKYFIRSKGGISYTYESALNNNESYFINQWHKSGSKQIAKDLGICLRTVFRTAARLGLPGKKRVEITVRPDRYLCDVLNLETGIFYKTVPECARAHGIKKTTLKDYFKGRTNPKKYKKFIKLK